MLCALVRLFMVSSLSFGFSVVGFNSPPIRLLIFFSCIPWCWCAELVFWSFGFFYLEFCGLSLAWAPCMCLFSLWGASYLLAGGCASGALDMCPFISWCFVLVMIILFLTRFFGFFCAGAWSQSFVFRRLFCLIFYLFTFFWHLIVLAKTFYGKMRYVSLLCWYFFSSKPLLS